jgi:hypothetical protein
MAGKQEAYIKSVASNVTRLAGLTTTIIGAVGKGHDEDVVGIARGDSEAWRELKDAMAIQTPFDINHVRLIVGERTLLGAVVMGDQFLSLPLEKMIAGEVDISSIRSKLLMSGAAIGELISDYWSQWRKLHTS